MVQYPVGAHRSCRNAVYIQAEGFEHTNRVTSHWSVLQTVGSGPKGSITEGSHQLVPRGPARCSGDYLQLLQAA